MTRSLLLLVTLLFLPAAALPAGAQDTKPAKAADARPSAAPLDINTATAAQLEALPGIGASTAARIVEFRQKNGAFKKVEDLMNVRGIGEKSFLKLKPLITAGQPRAERPAGE